MACRVHGKAAIVTFLCIILCTLLSNYIHFRSSICACNPCLTESDDEDSWFFERFQAQVHPLMSRKSSSLSEKTSKWWKVRASDPLNIRMSSFFNLKYGFGYYFVISCHFNLDPKRPTIGR